MSVLETEYLGMKLKNPVIIAAGPWSSNGSKILQCFETGAAAVVTESIVSDTLLDPRPRIAYNGSGVANIRLYSDVQIEGWEREMAIAKSGGGTVIANVSASTPSEIAYLAAKMERFGADALELSVSNPMYENLEVMASDVNMVAAMTREVTDCVNIPVIVKLSQNTTNIANVARAAKEAGADGVSAINTIRCILGVDIDSRKPMLGTYGGYSGAPIKPLGLASVATVAQTVGLPVSGIGGISTWRDALEYIMLGAGTVQVASALMLHGPSAVQNIISGMEKWAEEQGLDSIDEILGSALYNLRSFDEMKIEPATSTVSSVPCSADCDLCTHCCLDLAIHREKGQIRVDEDRCTGCGLCTFVCPAHKLELTW